MKPISKRTIDEHLAVGEELWVWLAEHPSIGSPALRKLEWPKWDEYGESINQCPLCDLALQRQLRNKYKKGVMCNYCPISWTQGVEHLLHLSDYPYCINSGTAYHEWTRAITTADAMDYASLIALKIATVRMERRMKGR